MRFSPGCCNCEPPDGIEVPCCPGETFPATLTCVVTDNTDCALLAGTYTLSYDPVILQAWFAHALDLNGPDYWMTIIFKCLQESPPLWGIRILVNYITDVACGSGIALPGQETIPEDVASDCADPINTTFTGVNIYDNGANGSPCACTGSGCSAGGLCGTIDIEVFE